MMDLFEKISQLNTLFEEIRAYKQSHPETACGYSGNYGSLLNAYREGDIGFDECIELLRKVPGINRENSKRHLPQASDLEDIDFTGGLNPTKYIRRLRGDKPEHCAVCKSFDPALCIAIRYGVHDQDRDDREEKCECSCHEDLEELECPQLAEKP